MIKKDKILTVRVDAKTYEKISRAAKRRDESKADFSRRAIFRELGLQNPQSAEDEHSSPRKRKPTHPITHQAVNRLGAITVILYRLADRINNANKIDFEQGLLILNELQKMTATTRSILRSLKR